MAAAPNGVCGKGAAAWASRRLLQQPIRRSTDTLQHPSSVQHGTARPMTYSRQPAYRRDIERVKRGILLLRNPTKEERSLRP
jgi:hypothetical protein